MADIAEIHELLESVRVTLASSMNPEREELNRLHQELDSEIRQANKRLRECDALLAEGHRSEAIQLAEQEPNLLEVVSILDFPELPEWNDFVAELGITVTPELQIDIATDINGAYSEDAPLERLLRKFRVLSLGRAPLRTRIDLLRQIAKRDSGTAYWKEDLKSYEQARIRQIADESRNAISAGDITAVHRLSEELHQKSWLVKPDRRVVERINQTMGAYRKLDAVRQLSALTQQIRQAQTADDKDLGRTLGPKWYELAEKCDQRSTAFHDAKEEAGPWLKWIRTLDEEDEDARLHAAEIKKLQKAMRSQSCGIDDLYRHYDRVAEFEQFEVPEAVQMRFESRIAEIEKQQKVQKTVIVGTIAVGVMVFLGIAYQWIFG